MNSPNITFQIEAKALEIIGQHPDGIRWVDLNRLIHEAHPDFHPKTINGTVWKLPEKYPGNVTKAKGIFRPSK